MGIDVDGSGVCKTECNARRFLVPPLSPIPPPFFHILFPTSTHFSSALLFFLFFFSCTRKPARVDYFGSRKNPREKRRTRKGNLLFSRRYRYFGRIWIRFYLEALMRFRGLYTFGWCRKIEKHVVWYFILKFMSNKQIDEFYIRNKKLKSIICQLLNNISL